MTATFENVSDTGLAKAYGLGPPAKSGRTRGRCDDNAGWHIADELVVPDNLTRSFCHSTAPDWIRSSDSGFTLRTAASSTALQRHRRDHGRLLQSLERSARRSKPRQNPWALSLARKGQPLVRLMLTPRELAAINPPKPLSVSAKSRAGLGGKSC